MRWLQLHSYSPPAAASMVDIGIRVKTLITGLLRIVCRLSAACGALALTCWCIRVA
jgi:hypothetical protein